MGSQDRSKDKNLGDRVKMSKAFWFGGHHVVHEICVNGEVAAKERVRKKKMCIKSSYQK